MQVVRFLILCCLGALSAGSAHAQPPHGPPPHEERPAMTPEQDARLQARRERLRLLREEMMRDMRGADGMPPAQLYPSPDGRGEGPRRRAGWTEDGPPSRTDRPPPRPPQQELAPGEERGREAGQPRRLSPEERKQLRRQMRDAAREVYGE